MITPFFSIIIPTYNRTSFIKKTIDSVLVQSFNDFEIIIVDDGSTDNTKDIIDTINDKRINYFYKENGERGAARNYGIKKAKGKYITFLDSDDLLLSNHFEEANKFIKANNPIIFHQQYQINDNGKTKKVKINLPIQKALIKGNPLSCMGVFIKSNIATENLFNEKRDLSGTEDYELWLRYSSKYHILFNPVCTSSLMIHDNRSVYSFDEEKLVNRRDILVDSIKNNKQFISKYNIERVKRIESNMNTYIALHLALSKADRKTIMKYLLKGVSGSIYELFSKRTLAIIKRLF